MILEKKYVTYTSLFQLQINVILSFMYKLEYKYTQNEIIPHRILLHIGIFSKRPYL